MTEANEYSIRGQIIVENPPKDIFPMISLKTRAGKIAEDVQGMVSIISDGSVRVRYRPTGASKIEEIGKGLNGDNTLLTLMGKGNIDEIKLRALLINEKYSIKAYDMRESN